MKSIDWLKFIGAYAGGVALAIVMESVFRGSDPTAPWRTNVALVLTVLNAGLALLVGATAGWKDGLAPALQLAVVGAVLVPTVSQGVIWVLSRKTRRVDKSV